MPSLIRRRLLGASAGAAVLESLGLLRLSAVAQPAVAGEIRLLSDYVHVLSLGDSNVVLATDDEGVVLVDGGSAEQASVLADQLSSLPYPETPKALFNTCWHPDRTGLNEVLGRAGVPIIAHENSRLWMTREITWPWDGTRFEPMPEVGRPNRTFYEKGSLTLGDKDIEYGHVRARPHTDGDTYVFLRDANVLAVGEAVSGQGWSSIDWRTGGWLGGIVGALEQFLSLTNDDTQIVPARGRVLDRGDLEEQHEMYDVLYGRFVELLYDGKSTEEAVAARPTAEFDSRYGPSEQFVARAFQSLWGYLTPDA